MDKPTLTFYTNIPTPYQISFFRELARCFELKVVYYSASESNRTWNFSLKDDYHVIVLRNNWFARFVQNWILDFHFSWDILHVLRKDDSKYVIVGGGYWIPNGALALIVSHLKSKKVVYFSEPLFVVKNRFKFIVKWLSLRIVNTCCDALFCIGSNAVKSFNNFDVKVPKYIVPYNINIDEFIVSDKVKQGKYLKTYKNHNEVIILTSGALVERKGMDILIKAIKQITNPNIRLIIIGDGPQKKALVELSGGDSRIVFAGFQQPEDIPYYFSIADVFAFASKYDGWAVVINEAIAANVPIVCSDTVGAGKDLISHEVNGYLCSSGDIEAFRKAIDHLINNKEDRARIKQEMTKLLPSISSQYYADYVRNLFLQKI